MQSTLTSTETDPHGIFVVEPDVVLAARADHAASDPISSLLAPPIHPAPELSATTPIPPAAPTFRAAVADDIEVPRDIHVSGERPPRGRWARRAIFGFLFALGSAAAAEGWDHYGDTAKAVIANWTPFVLNSAPPPEKAAAAGQPGAPDVQVPSQAAAADQAAAPAAQPAPDAAPTATAPPVAAASPPSPPPMARDLAAMGQQIEALKASIEQLKAGQEQMAQQMAQQMARNSAARPTQARTSQATPSDIRPADQSLRAKVTAALSPRPAAPPPPRRPRPAYPPAPGYVPSQAAAALPPAIAAPPPPQPAPLQYEPRTQAVDQADGDPVVRPPMPVR